MVRIHLERTFNVEPELLWELVVDPDHYGFWTEPFAEGSEFVGGMDQRERYSLYK